MNYGVHALMYFYFFLTSLGYKPVWNLLVTVLQISQMVVGVAVCAAVAYRKYSVRVGVGVGVGVP
jgi:elongation of very long chain fatty acids protein 6